MKTYLFSVLLSACIVCEGTAQAGPVERINISSEETVCDNFVGVGVQWSAYPHADSEDSEWGLLMTAQKWEMLYDRLDYMQPRFMRVIDQANWRYFSGLDENGRPVLNFDNQEINALFKILDYCEKNNITVMIGEWGVPGHKHDRDRADIRLRDASDMRWIRMIGEWLDFLLNKKGYTCIKYYDFINEPNGYWACTEGNFSEWALGVKLLYEELVSRGLDKKIRISGPGSVPNYTAPKFRDKYPGAQWVSLASEVLGGILGAYNTHAYYPHQTVRAGQAAEYIFLQKDVAVADAENKPFLLGEIGLKASKDTGDFKMQHEMRMQADKHTAPDCNMYVYSYFFGIDIASAAIQSLLAGVDGMAVWDLDDAMHTRGDLGDKSQLKRWGFWNILGTELHNNPADENIRPWYYAWSWLCRFMPQQSRLMKSSQPSNRGCQVLAATYGSDCTIYLVNTSEKDEKLEIKDAHAGSYLFNQLTYNEKYARENPVYGRKNIGKVDLRQGIRIDLPAKTFIVLTSMNI
jgi:hypothetical protein